MFKLTGGLFFLVAAIGSWIKLLLNENVAGPAMLLLYFFATLFFVFMAGLSISNGLKAIFRQALKEHDKKNPDDNPIKETGNYSQKK